MSDVVVIIKPPTNVNAIGRYIITYDASRKGEDGLELFPDNTAVILPAEQGNADTINQAIATDARGITNATEQDRVIIFGGVTFIDIQDIEM